MTQVQRRNQKERSLDAPMMTFNLNRHIDQLKSEESWKIDDRNGITLLKTSKLRVVLVLMKEYSSMLEHTVEGPLTLHVLKGSLEFFTGEERLNLKANELLTLDGTIPHNIDALEDTAFLLTIVQP